MLKSEQFEFGLIKGKIYRSIVGITGTTIMVEPCTLICI